MSSNGPIKSFIQLIKNCPIFNIVSELSFELNQINIKTGNMINSSLQDLITFKTPRPVGLVVTTNNGPENRLL